MELPAGLTTRSLRPDDARAVFDLMVDSQTLDAGEPSVDLEDVVGDWQRPSFDLATHAVGVADAGRLVGYAARGERPVRRRRGRVDPPGTRDRDVAGGLDPGRGEAAGRVHGRDAGPRGQRRRPPARAAGLPRRLDVLGAPAGRRRADREPAAAGGICGPALPPGRGARPHTGSSRTPSTSGRTASRWRTTTGRPGSSGGRVSSPGTCAWRAIRAARSSGVGYVFVSGEYGYVPTLAVRRDRRGRGLARALLVDCFAVAREHGASRSELSTDSRTGALGLYERVGMRVTSTWVHRADRASDPATHSPSAAPRRRERPTPVLIVTVRTEVGLRRRSGVGGGRQAVSRRRRPCWRCRRACGTYRGRRAGTSTPAA